MKEQLWFFLIRQYLRGHNSATSDPGATTDFYTIFLSQYHLHFGLSCKLVRESVIFEVIQLTWRKLKSYRHWLLIIEMVVLVCGPAVTLAFTRPDTHLILVVESMRGHTCICTSGRPYLAGDYGGGIWFLDNDVFEVSHFVTLLFPNPNSHYIYQH